MKSMQINKKYIEWKSPEELHEASLNWISELKFVKVEQQFLEELIANHSIEMLEKKLFDQSSKIVSDLNKEQKNLDGLIKKIISHYNGLELLVDGKDEPEKEKKFKEEHYKYAKEVTNYLNEYKQTKRQLFKIITGIMKVKKQRRLLH